MMLQSYDARRALIALMSVFSFAILFSIMSTISLAHGFSQSDLDKFQSRFNSEIQNAPGIAKSLISDERVNVIVDQVGDFGFTTQNAMIIGTTETHYSDPTLVVTITQSGYNDLVNGTRTIAQLMESGDIQYEGKGVINSIKVAIANFFYSIYRWFSNVF